MQDFRSYDALGLAMLVRQGRTSASELLDASLACLSEMNPILNAVVASKPDIARTAIDDGLPDGPFTGVPFLLKDIGAEHTDLPASDGSALMAGLPDSQNATLVDRLQASGLVIYGRTATPENAVGVATEARANGGPTRNPWNLDHTPGGSSGGAAAAVAAGIVPAAHGSDGGGSVRIPASCTGLFGFKPTRARLPDGPHSGEGWGGMATDGFLTRTVRDTAALLDVCIGADTGAPYHAPPLATSFTDALDTAPGKLRIALCDTTFDGKPIDPVCRDAVHDVASLLKAMGHKVVAACPSGPDHQGMITAWTDIVACGTALSIRTALTAHGRNLQDSDLEPLSHAALAHARRLSGQDYLAALNRIHLYGRSMAAWFRDWDILLTPTLAEPPAKVGRFDHDRNDFAAYRYGPGGIYDYSPFTASFNATGQPAMSVPLCMSPEGLPLGIHLAARFGEDDCLMSLAADLERARPWFHHVPKVSC